MALAAPILQPSRLTADEFWQFASRSDYWGELIEGEVCDLTPPGFEQGIVAHNVSRRLGNFVEMKKIGRVLDDAGFVLFHKPDTVQAPDMAFIRSEKLAAAHTEKFSEVPPDLAVEVISPSETHASVMSKARMYLKAGVEEIWIADPSAKTVTIYRSLHEARILEEGDSIETPLLPGFNLPVKEIFE